MTTIPQNRRWTISNSGRVFGSLYNARNVQFDDEGRLTLSKRPVSIYTSADDAAFGQLLAVVPFGTTYFLVTSAGCFTANLATLAVAINNTSGAPTVGAPESDAVNWQGFVYVTGQTNLNKWSGAAWTNSIASGVLTLTDDFPHPLCVFENLNCLAVANKNNVYLLKTDHTQQGSTLVIPADYTITSMRYRQNNVYIGTKHNYLGEARMFIWNGSGTAAQNAPGVKSNWIFSMEEFQSSMCCVTNAGHILRFNGGGFDVIGKFPVSYSKKIWQSSNSGSSTGKVVNRGMIADGDILYINIDGDITQKSNNNVPDGFLYNQPSGLWCLDSKVGLYPKSISSGDKYLSATVSSIDATTNELTLDSGTTALTGDPISITSVGSITGISTITYFVRRLSSTVIKLALTPFDAQEDNVIDIDGSAGGATVNLPSYRNIGDVTFSVTQGAIGLVSAISLPPIAFDTNIIWGATAASPISTATNLKSLNVFSPAQNIGSFEIQRLYTSAVKETWQSGVIKYGGLYLDTDKIVIKARTRDRFGTPSVIFDLATWTDNQTFTVTQSVKSFSAFEIGDEIIIVKGSKSGYTTHVTSISNNGLVWTIGTSESIGTTNETFYFYLDTWKKIKTITTREATNAAGYAEFSLNVKNNSKNPRIDIKVEIYGHETFVEDIDVFSIPNIIRK